MIRGGNTLVTNKLCSSHNEGANRGRNLTLLDTLERSHYIQYEVTYNERSI